MNVIVLNPSRPKARCKCCNRPAMTAIGFQGPDADRSAKVELCEVCRRLLGYMLIEDGDLRTEPIRNVV